MSENTIDLEQLAGILRKHIDFDERSYDRIKVILDNPFGPPNPKKEYQQIMWRCEGLEIYFHGYKDGRVDNLSVKSKPGPSFPEGTPLGIVARTIAGDHNVNFVGNQSYASKESVADLDSLEIQMLNVSNAVFELGGAVEVAAGKIYTAMKKDT